MQSIYDCILSYPGFLRWQQKQTVSSSQNSEIITLRLLNPRWSRNAIDVQLVQHKQEFLTYRKCLEKRTADCVA